MPSATRTSRQWSSRSRKESSFSGKRSLPNNSGTSSDFAGHDLHSHVLEGKRGKDCRVFRDVLRGCNRKFLVRKESREGNPACSGVVGRGEDYRPRRRVFEFDVLSVECGGRLRI